MTKTTRELTAILIFYAFLFVVMVIVLLKI